jgi:hypothetical protein
MGIKLLKTWLEQGECALNIDLKLWVVNTFPFAGIVLEL